MLSTVTALAVVDATGYSRLAGKRKARTTVCGRCQGVGLALPRSSPLLLRLAAVLIVVVGKDDVKVQGPAF